MEIYIDKDNRRHLNTETDPQVDKYTKTERERKSDKGKQRNGK